MTAQELFTSICGRIPDALVPGVVLGITSEGPTWCAGSLVPQRKFGYALATNSLNGALFAREVVRDLLMKFLGNDEPEPQEVTLDRSRMLEYSARYSAASSDLELSLEERRLKVQPRPKGGFPTQGTPPGPSPPSFRIGFVGPIG
jgi:hypothetical protein